MSGCDKYQELISRMIDEDLNAQERALLAEHLQSCKECTAMYAAFSALSLAVAEDLEEPPEALRENVMAQLRREEMAKKNRRISKPYRSLLAAAACMALIIGLSYGAAPLLGNKNNAAVSAADMAAPAAAYSGGMAAQSAAGNDAGQEAVIRMLAEPEEDIQAPSDEPQALAESMPEAESASAPAPAPIPYERAAAGETGAADAYADEDHGTVAMYMELLDGKRQEAFMDLLKGRIMTLSAPEQKEDSRVTAEELDGFLAYIVSLDEAGEHQINIYIYENKVYFVDSETGKPCPAVCTVDELEALIG